MAGNGGIIGPCNSAKAELITAVNATGCFTTRAGTTSIDVLIIAGGGGGGSGGNRGGGGGGAGGYQQSLAVPVSGSTAYPVQLAVAVRVRQVMVKVPTEVIQSDLV